MKRFLAALLIIMMIPFPAYASFNDITENNEYSQAIEQLKDYGVLSGDSNGNFNPNNNITRAEFSKIAALLSGDELQTSKSGLFSDLKDEYWANSYINHCAKKGIIKGYYDGKFYPNKNITYAEAITIMLRLLDYGTDELGNDYPYSYLKKAEEIGLTKGINFSSNQLIDRQNTALIAERALMCDTNSTGSRKRKLIEKLDYSLSDKCIILATKKENESLLSDEVATSIGTYKTISDNLNQYIGSTVKLVLNTDGEIVTVISDNLSKKEVIINSISNDTVSYSLNNKYGSVKFDSSSLFYYNLEKSTFEEIKDELEPGMKMNIIYSKSGNVDYVVVTDNNSSKADWGLLISCDTRVEDGSKKNFAKFMLSNGKTKEFLTLKNYDSSRGKVALLKTVDGVLEPSFRSDCSITGVVDEGFRTIGKYSLSSDCKIIDLLYAPGSEDHDAVAEFIGLSEISKDELKSDDVLYYELDKNGSIQFLVLNNITKKGYKYGIIKSVSVMGKSSSYTIDINGEESTYSVNSVNKSISRNSFVMANIQDNQLLKIYKLTQIKTKGELNSISDEFINIGVTNYPMYEDGPIYIYTSDNKFNLISKKDLNINKVKSIDIFADTEINRGGLIRAVKVTMK